jgi:hypothetical protein
MNAEIKTLWVAALRSGEYKQGERRLRDPETNTFCCLGVLCNLHAQAHPEIAAKQTAPGSYMGKKGFPHTEVFEWAGLDARAEVEIGGACTRLDAHNDSGCTFEQIADAIEEQL